MRLALSRSVLMAAIAMTAATAVAGSMVLAGSDGQEAPATNVPRPANAVEAQAAAIGYAERYGMVSTAKPCEKRTAADVLAEQHEAAARTGGPVEGWLIDAPSALPIWICEFTGTFAHSATKLEVQVPGAGSSQEVGANNIRVPEVRIVYLDGVAQHPLPDSIPANNS